MPVLYVVEQGAQIGKEADSLVVRKHDRELTRAPMHRVSQVVLFGGVQITAAAVDALLDRAIAVDYLTQHGRFKGSLQPALGKNIVLRRGQFRRADDAAFCLGVARAVARGKLQNQRAACLRWERQRGTPDDFAQQIERHLKSLEDATTPGTLLGLEGTCTRHYYGAMRTALRPDFEFPRRTRRPPTDPISVLLSLSAALLQSQVHAAICLVGFDPFLGFYHTEKYGRPALVLDLMEEFRPLVADAVVVSAVNLQVVKPDDFGEDERGLVLKEHAVEAFVGHFDKRVRDAIAHPTLNETGDYRHWIEFQARILAQAVLGGLPEYVPFTPGH